MHKKRNPLLLLVTTVALIGLVASVAAQAAFGVAQNEEYGPHLTTDAGRTLYLYVEDSETESTCVDSCTRNWPPLLVGEGEVTVGEGADASLLGTITRPDGTEQVTYGGHPLYTFARDTDEGTTRGQRLGDAFFLVSPAGESITDKLPPQRAEIDPELYDTLMADGAQAYTSNCAVCHGAEGGGGIGPKLAGNSVLGGADFVVERVLNGFIEHGMPPFRDSLNDHQIAAVVTYIRDAWGNDFGPVLEEEVSSQR